MNKTIWQFLAPADRETFISGTIAWLMDYNGNHGLKKEFLKETFQRISKPIDDSANIQIATEDSLGTDKRFDISVKVNGNLFTAFEVKCKTTGTKKQLDKYSEETSVARIAFDEWNFPNLDDGDREKYPLIKFSEINKILKCCKSYSQSQYFNFLDNFANHLKIETDYFEYLKSYFIDENKNDFPESPNFHNYSQRFYNMLYWNWFSEILEKRGNYKDIKLNTKSETSGVWFTLNPETVDINDSKYFNSLNLHLPGKFKYWVHIELANKTGITANKGAKVGYIQLRICEESDRDNIYKLISSQKSTVKNNRFTVTKRKPSKNSYYYSALTRKLYVEDFRYSKLTEIIDMLI